MKIYAVNGSPRKHNNTAALLQSALDGATTALVEEPVETEMIHLYDMDYKSCISCFGCKRLGGKYYGKCAIQDELTPVLEKLSQADGIVFGSPIYCGNITGKMKSFFERLTFPYTVYDMEYSSIAPRALQTAFIYTMNVTKEFMESEGYPQNFHHIEMFTGKTFHCKPTILYSFDTYQFDDYSKYKVEVFSEEHKAERKRNQFPLDCRDASQIGQRMVHDAYVRGHHCSCAL